jgi:hypothetical protein
MGCDLTLTWLGLDVSLAACHVIVRRALSGDQVLVDPGNPLALYFGGHVLLFIAIWPWMFQLGQEVQADPAGISPAAESRIRFAYQVLVVGPMVGTIPFLLIGLFRDRWWW